MKNDELEGAEQIAKDLQRCANDSLNWKKYVEAELLLKKHTQELEAKMKQAGLINNCRTIVKHKNPCNTRA